MNLVPTSKYWMSTIYLYPEIIGCLLGAGGRGEKGNEGDLERGI